MSAVQAIAIMANMETIRIAATARAELRMWVTLIGSHVDKCRQRPCHRKPYQVCFLRALQAYSTISFRACKASQASHQYAPQDVMCNGRTHKPKEQGGTTGMSKTYETI